MKQRSVRLTVLFAGLCVMVLLAACAAGPAPEGEAAAGAATSGEALDEVDAAQAEATPALPDAESVELTNPEVAAGEVLTAELPQTEGEAVAAAGEVTGTTPGGLPAADAPAAAELPPPDPAADPLALPELTDAYRNPDSGFGVMLPAGAEALVTTDVSAFVPAPLEEVRFFSAEQVAAGSTDYATPMLSVRVYENPEALAGETWLRQAAPELLEGAGTQPVTAAGQEAVQLCSNAPIGGGCTVYVAHGGRMLALTPVGPEGEAILASLTLE